MSKQRFVATKNNLPRNWAQQVSKSLCSKGIQVTPGQVSDARRGRNTDDVLIEKIKQEVAELKKITKQKKKKRVII